MTFLSFLYFLQFQERLEFQVQFWLSQVNLDDYQKCVFEPIEDCSSFSYYLLNALFLVINFSAFYPGHYVNFNNLINFLFQLSLQIINYSCEVSYSVLIALNCFRAKYHQTKILLEMIISLVHLVKDRHLLLNKRLLLILILSNRYLLGLKLNQIILKNFTARFIVHYLKINDYYLIANTTKLILVNIINQYHFVMIFVGHL